MGLQSEKGSYVLFTCTLVYPVPFDFQDPVLEPGLGKGLGGAKISPDPLLHEGEFFEKRAEGSRPLGSEAALLCIRYHSTVVMSLLKR